MFCRHFPSAYKHGSLNCQTPSTILRLLARGRAAMSVPSAPRSSAACHRCMARCISHGWPPFDGRRRVGQPVRLTVHSSPKQMGRSPLGFLTSWPTCLGTAIYSRYALSSERSPAMSVQRSSDSDSDSALSRRRFLVLRAENIGIPPRYAPLLGLIFDVTYTAFSWPAGRLGPIGRADSICRQHGT